MYCNIILFFQDDLTTVEAVYDGDGKENDVETEYCGRRL